MKLRFLFWVIPLSLFLHSVASAQFVDIQKDSLSFLYQQNIIDGHPDGTFRPKVNINRAEMIKMLMKVEGIEPEIPSQPCFSDVHGSDWYGPFVCTAKKRGWVQGYADGNFRPAQAVNKAEALKIAANVLGFDVQKIPEKPQHVFQDVHLSDWFYPFVTSFSEPYLIDWTSQFSSASPMNREMLAEILFRNIVRTKLYSVAEVQSAFTDPVTSAQKLTKAQALALSARDFFRVPPLVQKISLDQVESKQGEILTRYQQIVSNYAKGDYTFDALHLEDWNYKVKVADGNFVYGIFYIRDPERELQLPTYGRSSQYYATWAVLKYDAATKKLLAYDFFTKRGSGMMPNIVSVHDDVVQISLGHEDVDPTLIYKDGEKLNFHLRDFRPASGVQIQSGTYFSTAIQKELPYLWIDIPSPAGIFIYMHGAGGGMEQGMSDTLYKANFKALKDLLATRHFIYVTPSTTDFEKNGGHDLNDLALTLSKKYPSLPIYLSGASAGGRTVYHALLEGKNIFRKVVFLCPAVGVDLVDQWKQPVEKIAFWIVQGDQDLAVNPDVVDSLEAKLKASGNSVVYKKISGDHNTPVEEVRWDEALDYLLSVF